MEHIFSEVKTLILGDKSIGLYIAAFFFSFLAILLSLYLRGKKKFKYAVDTPTKFSWVFLLWDNLKRIAVGMIVMFLLFRFNPFHLSMEWALGIGFFVSMGVDRAIQWLQGKFDFLNMDRQSFPAIPTNTPPTNS